MLHFFNPTVAVEYGVNAAILLQNIHFWCEHNRTNGKYLHEGRYWTYNSRKAFVQQFPYMGEKQVRNALQKLEDEGLIVSGNYNHLQYDRTTWYAITEKGIEAINTPFESDEQKGPMHVAERANGECQKGQPIPDIYSDTLLEEEVVGGDPVQRYATDNLAYLSPTAMQELASFLEDVPDDLVRYAIDLACEQNKRTWAYTKSILNRWVAEGVRTVGEAKAAADKFRASQNKPSPQDKPAKRKDWDEMTEEERKKALANGPFGKWVD